MFLSRFITSPVKETLLKPDFSDCDQLRFEHTMRTLVAKRNLEYPGCRDYASWSYHYQHGAIFVDRSSFYFELANITFDAVTELSIAEDRMVPATLWTYGAVTVWLNGNKVHSNDEPCYKPIMKYDFNLDLKSGKNELYIRFQNLGVRDTRNLFGIEIQDAEGIAESVPYLEDGMGKADFLDGTVLVGNTLHFPSGYVYDIGFDSRTKDFQKQKMRFTWETGLSHESYRIPEGNAYVSVRVKVGDGYISRKFEVAEYVNPDPGRDVSVEENYLGILKDIASISGFSKNDKVASYITNILARKALGAEDVDDEKYFLATLDRIERREDCSDFLLSGVIRYLKNYSLSDSTFRRTMEVLENYRYWMTMDGADAMCFWSENHSLLFYSCAMLIGEMYPDMHFNRAGMDGRELSAYGRRLTSEWFDDLEKFGFEEFLSTVYLNVTFACLLNIVDYADAELSSRASNAIDLMFRELCLHTFQGSIIAPMGRVYREIINPCKQGAQTMMNFIDPRLTSLFGDGWLSYLATSKYRLPEGLQELQSNDADSAYSTGDSLVKLRKRHEYCLTSVASPRMDGFERWENITLGNSDDVDRNTHLFTKSFNERFHGTTFFEPGTYGYQQHMWVGALSPEAIVFVNHPGDTYDSSSMRPGYWYGNGVMPAVQQKDNMIGSIYRIPDEYPVKFVHMFLPECKFDYVEYYGDNWIFLSKGEGYIGIWYSRRFERYNDELSYCELRFPGKDSAFLCIAGSRKEYGSFEGFKSYALEREIIYLNSSNKLYVDDSPFVEYTESFDKTQYI